MIVVVIEHERHLLPTLGVFSLDLLHEPIALVYLCTIRLYSCGFNRRASKIRAGGLLYANRRVRTENLSEQTEKEQSNFGVEDIV